MNPPPPSRTSPQRGQVTVLTGPPGAGESTVAHLQADRLNLGVYEPHVLDSTTLTAEATSDSMLRGVATGTCVLDPNDSVTR